MAKSPSVNAGSSNLAIPPQDLVAFKGIASFTGVAAFAFFRRLLLHFKHRGSQLCLQCVIANGMFLHRYLLIEWIYLALASADNYDTLAHQAFLLPWYKICVYCIAAFSVRTILKAHSATLLLTIP